MATAAGKPKNSAMNNRANNVVWGGAFGGTGILIVSVAKNTMLPKTSVIPDHTRVEVRAQSR